jgi:hypothetical protein
MVQSVTSNKILGKTMIPMSTHLLHSTKDVCIILLKATDPCETSQCS